MAAGCCPDELAKVSPSDFVGGTSAEVRFGRRTAQAFEEAAAELLEAWEHLSPADFEAAYRAILKLPIDEAFGGARAVWDETLEEVAQRGGENGIAELKRRISNGRIELANGARLADLSFTVQNPYTRVYLRERSSRLVTSITDETRGTLSATLDRAVREGIPPRAIAREIGDAVGLHPRWAKAVERRRRELERTDLSPEDVNKAVAKYRAKLIRRRADNIARTEIHTANNQGTIDSWRIAQDRGIVVGTMGKKWIAGFRSARTCINCASMHGVIVPIDSAFATPLGNLERPPLHPSCRCTIGLTYEQGAPAVPLSNPLAQGHTLQGATK